LIAYGLRNAVRRIGHGTVMLAGLLCACTDTSNQEDASMQDEEVVQSLPNGALHFDGLADYATTGTAGFPNGNAPQTISLWVRYATAVGTQVFVSLRTDFTSGIVVGIRDGEVAAWTVDGRDPLVETRTLPPAGVWHYVAFVLSGGGGNGYADMLYIDGVLSATTASTPDKLFPEASWVGSLDGLTDFFAGDMDEIRIWTAARAVADIMSDMNGLTGPTAPGLVAHFSCDTVRGARVPDESGNGNDATLGGGDPRREPALVISTAP
jgi:hypothetical protein